MIHSDENRTEAVDETSIASSQDTPQPATPFRFGLRAAILSGLLLWLAHPAPGLWALAWLALIPLIVSVQAASNVRQASVRGYLFAWAYLAPTWYWTGLTIVGWTKSPIGWLALFLLTLLAAFFYAFWAAAAWWISRKAYGAWRIVGTAAAWVVMEWLRGVGWFSFPWAQVSYTQYRFLPIIQVAEVTGALGVSFLVLLVNASIAEWWRHRNQQQSQRWVISCVTIVALLCLSGFARMLNLTDGQPLNVGIMQGNFDYKTEGRTEYVIEQDKLHTFQDMTQAAYQTSNPKPQLYVWAETAAPGDALHNTWSRTAIQGIADRYHAAVFTGSRIVDDAIETNSALLFTPTSQTVQRFDKQGLVPFGEFIPFRAQFPASIQKRFQFFETDLAPGARHLPVALESPGVGKVSIGPFICYESVYPDYTRTMTARGANILVTPSHDQWFMSDAAMEQHLAIVVLRAVENRRDVARTTTDGVSAAIDGRGKIVSRAPMHTACFIVQELHLRSLITVYNRFGDWFVGLCVLLFGAAWMNSTILLWIDKATAKGHRLRSAIDPTTTADDPIQQ